MASLILIGAAASQSAPQSTALYKPDSPAVSPASSNYVARTTKAVNYRRASGSTRVDLQGTELLQGASAEVKVESKKNRMEIEAKFEGLNDATKFGLEYLTYVFWAVSAQGRAENLGEVVAKNGAAQVKAVTDMQTFGLIVTRRALFRCHSAWQHGRSRKHHPHDRRRQNRKH